MAATCVRQGILPGQLTIHADRGSSMSSKPVALLMADLGVTKTHSRPHVSNDNPFSEAQFKTLKYRPDYPERFGCQADARTWAGEFFRWYNYEHHHCQRHRSSDACRCAFRKSSNHFGSTSTSFACRLSQKSRAFCERTLHPCSCTHRRLDQSAQYAPPSGETITVVAVVEFVDKWAVLVPSTYPQTSGLKGVLSTNQYIADLH